jgi:hypothetical protein
MPTSRRSANTACAHVCTTKIHTHAHIHPNNARTRARAGHAPNHKHKHTRTRTHAYIHTTHTGAGGHGRLQLLQSRGQGKDMVCCVGHPEHGVQLEAAASATQWGGRHNTLTHVHHAGTDLGEGGKWAVVTTDNRGIHANPSMRRLTSHKHMHTRTHTRTNAHTCRPSRAAASDAVDRGVSNAVGPAAMAALRFVRARTLRQQQPNASIATTTTGPTHVPKPPRALVRARVHAEGASDARSTPHTGKSSAARFPCAATAAHMRLPAAPFGAAPHRPLSTHRSSCSVPVSARNRRMRSCGRAVSASRTVTLWKRCSPACEC